MIEDSWEKWSDGTLWFKYRWGSSTGELADLYNCFVREKVDYEGGNPYYWPSPPWQGYVNNPAIVIDIDTAAKGWGADAHSPPDFKKPYKNDTATCNQVYQYRYCWQPCCDPLDESQWNTLLTIGPITRTVSVSGNNWKYTITKSGKTATRDPLP